MKKQTTLSLKKSKNQRNIQMLTCYDYQTAKLLNETDLDMILVGDSLGNVILGFDTTIPVTLDHMIIFGAAVKRGAPDKFVVVDLPFGTYSTVEEGLKNGIKLFQQTRCEAIKLEGAHPTHIELTEKLTQNGIPVMGHIGLTPQSVHELGGYYTHGKDEASSNSLLAGAMMLEQAGAFSIVLECITPHISKEISKKLSIPTIGIGAGENTDGQVLVTNDLLKLGPETPPSFCKPVANLYELKKRYIQEYLDNSKFEESRDEKSN